MLRPTKYSHPDQTVINMSLLLLNKLRKSRIVGYNELLSLAKKQITGGNFLFLPALNFLYLMGMIEYRQKTDAIEYIGK
ncbi:hypothetical protein FAI40_10205 [Acetobacteraceae bacterium]|nr:hypothetical protein FAI40_10205 [Acetobacteraceae bacterium]